jgi:phosphohistidine phosphatase
MLFLIRHAHAAAAEEDALRPLSEAGREETRRLAQWLRPGGRLQPQEVWHSPLVRARETAEILAAELAWTAPLQVVPGLEPEDFPGRVAGRIAACAHSLALVGHNPNLTCLATLLVTGAADPPAFVFPKGAALALEAGRDRNLGSWQVCWMVTPQLRL